VRGERLAGGHMPGFPLESRQSVAGCAWLPYVLPYALPLVVRNCRLRACAVPCVLPCALCPCVPCPVCMPCLYCLPVPAAALCARRVHCADVCRSAEVGRASCRERAEVSGVMGAVEKVRG